MPATNPKPTCHGYNAGHPWYYVLGGAVVPVTAIRTEVLRGEYEGYLAGDIHVLRGKPEPQRTQAIDKMRAQIVSDLRNDLSRYRECARELRQYRVSVAKDAQPICDDIHVSLSLKHNHIYNGLANLRTLDALPKQGDLFDFL
ncbi:MAG: hypothetical protein ACRBBK_07325 [Paracoccaceae bacterium]